MTDSSTDSAGLGAGTSDASPAESSTANEGVKSYIETVNAALEATEEAPASASGDEVKTSKPQGEADKTTAEGEKGLKDPADPTDDEVKTYSPNAQTRIRELVERRKAVESQLTERDQEIQQLRPQAEQMDKLVGFMQTNSIQPEHLNNVMSITALIQTGRYEDALRAVGPIYEQLLEKTGNILPQELQAEVDAGYITRERAMELHRSRKAGENATQREKDIAERTQREREARESTDRINMMATTGDAWASEKKTSDPDWSTKQDLVTDEIELQLRRISSSAPHELPRDAAGVRKLLDKALATVESRLKQFRPTPQPIDPLRGKPASAGARAKPATYMDAINQALGETS